MSLVLLCNYFNAFNFYNVAELSSNRTGGNGLQVSTENENLPLCAHVLEFGHFTLLFGRGWRRNVSKFVMHVHSIVQLIKSFLY